MINNFYMIGKAKLDHDGCGDPEPHVHETGPGSTTTVSNKKKKAFLFHQTLLPRVKKNGIDRAIVLHFDLTKKEFRFELGPELTESNRCALFALKVGAAKDKKKFFATNNIESLLSSTITESLEYIAGRREDKKSKQWFADHIPTSYETFLETLRDTFYKQVAAGDEDPGNEAGFILDEARMAPDQVSRFHEIKEQLETKRSKTLSPIEAYKEFLKEIFKEENKTELPSIYLVKINGHHILDFTPDNTGESYLNLAYYDLFERYFVENVQADGLCYHCREKGDVVGQNIPLSMKFYGTTNELYFENTSNANAYKSFALCRNCLTAVLAGMKYTENILKDYILGLDVYMIPNLEAEDEDFEKKLKGAARLLKKKQGQYKDDIETLETLLQDSGKDKKSKPGFTFNLMFFHAEQKSFNILKYIASIELRSLIDKMARFDYYAEKYGLALLGKNSGGISFCLQDIRNSLFPSLLSHSGKNIDFRVYGKDLLKFLENFLSGHKMNYHELISRFTGIYKRRFNREKTQQLAPFKMVMFLSILKELDLIKEAYDMNKGTVYSEILIPAYREFFETHAGVYSENAYRQGLFLLGTVISKIIQSQKKKRPNTKLSSTFMRKLNFDGIPARRLKNLVGEVRDFSQIYDVFEEKGIWGNIMDRLQGIENSGMKGDEIVFYILTGISFAGYLGSKNFHDKKAAGTWDENDEDDGMYDEENEETVENGADEETD